MYLETKNPEKFNFEIYNDNRGLLVALDLKTIPFVVRRVFTIKGNGGEITRGGHAHKECWQFLYPSATGVKVHYINLHAAGIVDLSLGNGLLVPPFNWIEITIPNENVTVSVLASHSYNKDDYLYNLPNS